jgi:hypothetical protein
MWHLIVRGSVVNLSSMTHIFSELTPCCMVTYKLSVAQRHDELATLLLPRRLLSYRFLWYPGMLRSVLGHEPSSDKIRMVHTVNAGLRRRSASARPLRLWVRIPTGVWMFVCCECCVSSGIGLCDELITLLEESYRLWCVVVCDLETSRMRRPWPTEGCCARNKHKETNTLLMSFLFTQTK